MPVATVSHSNGTTPVISGADARTELILQNNSDTDFRIRNYGHVSMDDVSKRGLLLRKGGGSIVRTGAAAKLPVYAIHGAGSGITKQLDYESDVV